MPKETGFLEKTSGEDRCVPPCPAAPGLRAAKRTPSDQHGLQRPCEPGLLSAGSREDPLMASLLRGMGGTGETSFSL